MMTVRTFDERMQRAQRQGEISFYMMSRGEEAVSVAQAMALRPTDMLFPSYRTQGLHIARGRAVVDLMCQCLSNTRDMCKGRQMPVFYHWREGNIFSVSGNVATQLPQAVGWAMASRIKGDEHIAAAWVGEGSTAEGDFYYAITFASVYQAPALLNVVNNQWAISTCQALAGGERQTFAARGPGHGIPGIRVDGNDFLAVYSVTEWAAARARQGLGPTLIELVTYRAGSHSTSDDPSRYRAQNESDAWPLGDPIERLKHHLITCGQWSIEQHRELQRELDAHVLAAWRESLSYGSLTAGPKLSPESLFDDVFRDLPSRLRHQRDELLSLRR
jgi:2-oxoisovalerate dehydrogenase E1 component alpha subunit